VLAGQRHLASEHSWRMTLRRRPLPTYTRDLLFWPSGGGGVDPEADRLIIEDEPGSQALDDVSHFTCRSSSLSPGRSRAVPYIYCSTLFITITARTAGQKKKGNTGLPQLVTFMAVFSVFFFG